MLSLVTIGVGAMTFAVAQPAPGRGGPSELSVEDGFRAQLDEAKDAYFSGDLDAAEARMANLWTRMKNGEDPGAEARAETLTYLGEIWYRQKSFVAADAAFRWLLERDPDATMSPFHHPAEVVRAFDQVREQLRIEQARPVEPPPSVNPPAWTFLPFGVPQARQGRRGAAIAYGTAQAALAAGSLGTLVYLRVNDPRGDEFPNGRTEEEQARWINQRRYGVQWPLTFGFYAAWALSVRDSRRVWRQEQRALTVVPLGPPGTPGLTLTHRF